MNIFVTDISPIQSAKNLDDKRVVKMVLESAQLLSTAINTHGGKAPYKSTHEKHPCTKWVCSSYGNYMWLLRHFKALCEEYTARYGKTHKCEQYYDVFIENKSRLPMKPTTRFPNCTVNKEHKISYKHVRNIIVAYRKYLQSRWKYDKRKPTWKNGSEPKWMRN